MGTRPGETLQADNGSGCSELCEGKVGIRDALMNILPYWQMVAVEHRHWQMACLAVVCHMDGLVHEGEENEHEGRYQLGVMRNVYTAVYCSAPGYNVHSLSHLVRVPSMLHIILSLRLLPTYIHFPWPDVIHVINVPGLPEFPQQFHFHALLSMWTKN